MLMLQEMDESERGCLRTDKDRKPTAQEVYRFLEFLRSTGKTNMFGAIPYIEFYLDLPMKEARDHWHEWMFQTKEKQLRKLVNAEPNQGED